MVLVVGGAGFIGSHTLKALRQAGIPCTAFDNLSNGHRHALLGTPLIEGDTRNPADLRKAFEQIKPNAVIHFAAFIDSGESVREPGKYWQNNLLGTLNLLDVMAEFGCRQLIFSSTAGVYGNTDQELIAEDHPKNPISPYAQSKWAAECLIRAYESTRGVRSVCLRYFNAAGADPDGELGEEHNPETHLIPLAIDAALGRRGPLTLFGTDYPTPDGTCIRDYVHVSDLASAHVLALQYLEKGGATDVFNLGTGRGYSNREVIAAVEESMGMPVPLNDGPRRDGDPPRLVADSSKAKQILGFELKFPSIEFIANCAALRRR